MPTPKTTARRRPAPAPPPPHPAPKTTARRPINPSSKRAVHFWAPTFKWGISLANLADLRRPAELVSLPQQCALTATGVIWSRYSMVITPRNYNLLAVNVFMAATGIWQLGRKLTAPGAAAPVAAAPVVAVPAGKRD